MTVNTSDERDARWTLSSSGALAILLLGLLSISESVVVVRLYPNFRPVVSAGGFIGVFYGLYLAVGLVLAACTSGLERIWAGRARLADAAGPLVLGAAAIAYGFPTWRAIFVVNLLRPKSLVGFVLVVLVGVCVAAIAYGVLRLLPRRVHFGWASALLVPLGVGLLASGVMGSAATEPYQRPRLERGPGPAPRTILIFSFDALAADHMSAYGYERATSVELERTTQRFRQFDHAIAPRTETGPSLASLITGLYPPRHGVLVNGWGLSPRTPTLPRLLPPRYSTAAFVANPIATDVVNRAGFGIAEVFKGAPARKVLAKARGWLASNTSDHRMLWVHIIEPHDPYRPPMADLARFSGDRLSKEGQYTPYSIPAAAELFGLDPADEAATRAAINHRIAEYDAYIRSSTRLAADFIDEVIEQDPGAFVVVTADHGESMTEHGVFFFHGSDCYQPAAHIPMAVYYSALAAARSSRGVVSLVDIVPTICSIVECTGDEDFDGVSLLANSPADRLVFTSAQDNPMYQSYAAVDQEWKMILTPQRRMVPIDAIAQRRGALTSFLSPSRQADNHYRFRVHTPELYNLRKDPDELHNLVSEEPERAARMTSQLMGWLDVQIAGVDGKRATPVQIQQISDENMKRLRALGYIR